jgi:thiosulfate reductase cytochrome b subunit
MSEGVVDVAEDSRNKYMAFVAIVVIVVPIAMLLGLGMMVPNL